ncbi:MAG: ispH [Parachlamydiales bacterium]|nr:ispH [Parachlamydiales bacterium]
MKLLLSKPRGFCAGVERAIDTVKRALEIWGPPIYVKHQIVHNRHVVEELKAMGAIFIEDLKEVPRGSRLVFSAHGVPPSIRQEAMRLHLFAIDATCCLVTKVHSAAKRFAEKGYKIILIGHRNHVETIGTAGEAPHATIIVETVEDVEKLPDLTEQKIAYLTQTTLSLDDVLEITDALRRRFPQIEAMPSSSVCYATQNRQMALREISKTADLVLVVGDPKSSNSNRLREVAEKRGVRAYLVNSAGDIDPAWLGSVETIAMTAGASTPESIVQECVMRLRQLGVNSVEEIVYTEENVFFQLPKECLNLNDRPPDVPFRQ